MSARAEEVTADALRDYLARQVRRYLRDCEKFRLEPTPRRCLQVVYAANDEQQGIVRDLYRQLTGTDKPDDYYGQRRR